MCDDGATRLCRGCRRQPELEALSTPLTRLTRGPKKWLNATKGLRIIQTDDSGEKVCGRVFAIKRAGLRGLNEGQKMACEIVAEKRSAKSLADKPKPA